MKRGGSVLGESNIKKKGNQIGCDDADDEQDDDEADDGDKVPFLSLSLSLSLIYIHLFHTLGSTRIRKTN